MRRLIKVENLKTYFPVKKGLFLKTIGHIKAVDNVTFAINEGESFGIVGESGSGKTTLGRTILNLIPHTDGKVYYRDKNIFELDKKEQRLLAKKMQVVFQNPFSSLNPRKTVGAMIMEPLIFHKFATKKEAEREVFSILEKVGLSDDSFYRYPHEFSGGQRQRIGIARALILKPEFILLDEPVSALDVSVQAQILNLLKDLQKQFNLTYLFIAHNLNVVRFFCDKIAVMYLGQIVEIVDSKDTLFDNPLHPYTKLLIDSIPNVEKKKKKGEKREDEIPSILDLPKGCRFQPRCQYKIDKCIEIEPELKMKNKGHSVRCHLY